MMKNQYIYRKQNVWNGEKTTHSYLLLCRRQLFLEGRVPLQSQPQSFPYLIRNGDKQQPGRTTLAYCYSQGALQRARALENLSNELSHYHSALTFSSNALWCSNRLLSAFSTSTSLDTPLWAAACLFTTVMRSDRSCRDTRHSKCSNNNCGTDKKPDLINQNISMLQLVRMFYRFPRTISLVNITKRKDIE